MEQQTLEIFHHPAFLERAKDFYESYDLRDVIIAGDPAFSKRRMKRQQERVCRFCGRPHGQTTFSNLSHLLSKCIGNSNMYSDFECDGCNTDFSDFEDDFAAFLGFSRSIIGLGNGKKTPGFNARRLKAKSRSFIGDNILIVAPEDLKREGNKISITYTKNPFKESGVYKALLKYAMSILSEKEVKENYSRVLDYLAGNGVDRNYYYKGHCQNLQKRLIQHNSGMTESLRPYIPFEIAYFEEFETEQEAILREKYFKYRTIPARMNRSGGRSGGDSVGATVSALA